MSKLTKESNGDKETARRMQQERLDRMTKVKIHPFEKRDLVITKDFLNKMFSGYKGFDNLTETEKEKLLKLVQDEYLNQDIFGFYSGGNLFVFENLDRDQFEETIYHELLHASTDADAGIPKSTKNVLNDTFTSKPEGLGKWNFYPPRFNAYLRNNTERLVRKQILDRELEINGIKKYGEEFTKEHFEQMMQLYDEGGFSEDADEFISTTKRKYEVFKKIFDEVAIIDRHVTDGDDEQLAA